MRRVSRRTVLRLSSALVLSLAAATAHAATYQVSPNGNDANSGTSSQPWRTLQKAADVARAGDVVIVANGDYAGMEITTDGTASAPITFRAGGDDVVVNSANAETPDNINIEGGSHVVVEGFVVVDAPRNGIRAVTATGVKIRNNVIRNSGNTGILTGFTPGIEVSGNVVSDSRGEHGIYVANSNTGSDNPVIRGNECFGNVKNGIQLNGDCYSGGDGVISGAIIEDNLVHDNNWKGFSLISLQNSTIRNNVVYENGISAGAGGIHLADEPGCGKPSHNNVVANNTISEPRIAGIRTSNGSAGNKIFNNVVRAASLSKTIADDDLSNLVDPVTNLKLISLSGVVASASTGNFRLLPTSPAANTGASSFQGVPAPADDILGVPRPQYARVDIGAYEYTSTVTGIGDTPAAAGIALEQNYPNPFNPSTRIAYTVAGDAGARVSLHVFDVRGARVRTLLDNQHVTGSGFVQWDGRDDANRPVASGTYFYRLEANGATLTRRMTLLK